jgi:predicted nuclease with TOPRIM domain
MLSKKIICFFSVLMLLSALMYIGDASSIVTVSFSGGGVTIDLEYPEEAHPNATITHNVTITAHTDLSLQSFTLFIYASVNEMLQEIKNRTISWDFLENETLTSRIEFQLPQETNGTLYCEMTVKTDQTADTSSYKFYTTRVSELTFSEMQNLYYGMLANYTSLQEDYETLLDDYDSLLADYSSLSADCTALLSEYDTLADQYSVLNDTYQTLLKDYNEKVADYDDLKHDYDTLYYDNYTSTTRELGVLRSNYESLNSTYSSLKANCTSLQANYTSLQADYDALNKTYSDLLADLNSLQEDKDSALNTDRIIMIVFIVAVAALITFIVYLKRKKEEPYVVIRKETVSMKSDEET